MKLEPFNSTDVCHQTKYSHSYIIKLSLAGEIGKQTFKNGSWEYSQNDIDYLKERRKMRKPGRPRAYKGEST